MNSGDRKEFDAQIAILCAGYDKPLGDRAEAYWKGLHRMSLIEFARCVEYALGDDGPEKLPTVHIVRQILSKLKNQTRSYAQLPANEDPRDHLLFYANRMFLRHLVTREGLGSTGGFVPAHGMVDVHASRELLVARRFVSELVDCWAGFIREGDTDATQAEFVRQFSVGLNRISPIAEGTRRELGDRQLEPLAQAPFPPYMARELEQKYQGTPTQLALSG